MCGGPVHAIQLERAACGRLSFRAIIDQVVQELRLALFTVTIMATWKLGAWTRMQRTIRSTRTNVSRSN